MSYRGLTPSQLELGLALAASRRWRGRPGLCALRADGTLIEVRDGQPWPAGGVPFLTDAPWLGVLMDMLNEACGSGISMGFGSRGRGRSYCTLRAANGYERTWEAPTTAEAIGQALLARWSAIDRGRAGQATRQG